jgi:hypothetical protein
MIRIQVEPSLLERDDVVSGSIVLDFKDSWQSSRQIDSLGLLRARQDMRYPSKMTRFEPE